MTPGELAHKVHSDMMARGFGNDREWICSLLDCALAVGQDEVRGCVPPLPS